MTPKLTINGAPADEVRRLDRLIKGVNVHQRRRVVFKLNAARNAKPRVVQKSRQGLRSFGIVPIEVDPDELFP